MGIDEARETFGAFVSEAFRMEDSERKEALHFNALLATELRQRNLPIWDKQP